MEPASTQIMIVEDNLELCQLYERILGMKGYTIQSRCENGQEAIKYYESISEYPALILMDYRMPLKDGLMTSQEILGMNPRQKILIVSADTSVQYNVSQLGIIRFLKKPFNISELLQTMAAMLNPLDNL